MTLPNRVAPDGSLRADPARGLLFGNRGGRFHAAGPARAETPRRIQASRHWLCCRLDGPWPRRDVWGTGYTELFFCDEVTALAAGHRPCMACRRADALAYRTALAAAEGEGKPAPVVALDARLDRERRDGRAKRLHAASAEDLPDGAMITAADGGFLAIVGAQALLWSPAGYRTALARPRGTVALLTPPASVAALKAGYRPLWHPSATRLLLLGNPSSPMRVVPSRSTENGD
jgi:hypothetical protein